MEESYLVPVRVLTSEVEAEIAKAALEAFGIDCMISHDDCGGQRPHLSFSGGIRLLVRADDLQRAEEVLTATTEEAV
jgi:hypothetical protein